MKEQYVLEIPAQFEKELAHSFEDVLSERFTLFECGRIHHGESIYLPNGEVEVYRVTFEIDLDSIDLNGLVDMLNFISIPCGSKLLCKEQVVAEFGMLHHIRVDVIPVPEMDKSKFIDVWNTISEVYMPTNCVCSSYIWNPKKSTRSYFFYVKNLELGIKVLDEMKTSGMIGANSTYTTIDSGVTTGEWYVEYLRTVYDYCVPDSWNLLLAQFKQLPPMEWQELVKAYPHIPESLIHLLSTANGTKELELTEFPVNMPFFIHTTFPEGCALLPARQMYKGEEKEWIEELVKDQSLVLDEKISLHIDSLNICPFASSIIDGKKYALCLDFNPSPSGTVGQVLAYHGDAHTLLVIAPSFDEFLINHMGDDYKELIGEDKIDDLAETFEVIHELIDFEQEKDLYGHDMDFSLFQSMDKSGKHLAFVSLDANRFDMDQFKKDLQLYWNLETTDHSTGTMQYISNGDEVEDSEVLFGSINGNQIIVAPIGAPLPGVENLTPFEMIGYTEDEHTVASAAHVLVYMLHGDSTLLEKGKLFVKVLETMTHQECVTGIYVNDIMIHPDAYTQEAQELRVGQLPIMNMVGIHMSPTDQGLTLFTNGMNLYGKLELELIDFPDEIDKIWSFCSNIADYILSNDITLQDGDTIGYTDDMKVKITISDGVAVENQKTIKFTM